MPQGACSEHGRCRDRTCHAARAAALLSLERNKMGRLVKTEGSHAHRGVSGGRTIMPLPGAKSQQNFR